MLARSVIASCSVRGTSTSLGICQNAAGLVEGGLVGVRLGPGPYGTGSDLGAAGSGFGAGVPHSGHLPDWLPVRL